MQARVGARQLAGVVTVALFVTGVLGVAADRAAGDLTLSGARRAAELRPDVIRYHLLVAALASDEGTLAGIDEAIAATDEALDVSPHDPVARLAAARRSNRRGRWPPAPQADVEQRLRGLAGTGRGRPAVLRVPARIRVGSGARRVTPTAPSRRGAPPSGSPALATTAPRTRSLASPPTGDRSP